MGNLTGITGNYAIRPTIRGKKKQSDRPYEEKKKQQLSNHIILAHIVVQNDAIQAAMISSLLFFGAAVSSSMLLLMQFLISPLIYPAISSYLNVTISDGYDEGGGGAYSDSVVQQTLHNIVSHTGFPSIIPYISTSTLPYRSSSIGWAILQQSTGLSEYYNVVHSHFRHLLDNPSSNEWLSGIAVNAMSSMFGQTIYQCIPRTNDVIAEMHT